MAMHVQPHPVFCCALLRNNLMACSPKPSWTLFSS